MKILNRLGVFGVLATLPFAEGCSKKTQTEVKPIYKAIYRDHVPILVISPEMVGKEIQSLKDIASYDKNQNSIVDEKEAIAFFRDKVLDNKPGISEKEKEAMIRIKEDWFSAQSIILSKSDIAKQLYPVISKEFFDSLTGLSKAIDTLMKEENINK